jgi:hypothetical protein
LFEQPFKYIGKLAKDIGLEKGGKINRTGRYKLHKGERVLNARQTKAWDKAHRKKRKKSTTTKRKKTTASKRKPKARRKRR